MEVINARSALLSNYEVLSLLRELDTDHVARTKTAYRVKKEEEANGASHPGGSREPEILENLRTVEVEAIRYLSAEYQPTTLQSPAGIVNLVKDLARYDLTKAEKLQIVNLAPTEPVELYVIVEELEDRMNNQMDEILNLVSSSMSAPQPGQRSLVETIGISGDSHFPSPIDTVAYDEPRQWDDDEDQEFDDTGEGTGIEGDLDMEED